MLDERIKLKHYFGADFPVKILPKALFIVILTLVYISNAHYVENTVRKINVLETEVEDLRADYTTLKADLMFSSKQSEIVKQVKSMGLKKSKEPPYKIIVDHGEY